MKRAADPTWRNWSGEVRCAPRQVVRPSSIDEIVTVVREVASRNGRLRVAGSGHSFTPLVATDDVMLSLERLTGWAFDGSPDDTRHDATAKVFAGTTIADLGKLLAPRGQALENQGDIDQQAIGGAISTGTHGTGRTLGSLSTQVSAITLVTAEGEILECSPEREPDVFKAAQVSLGSLGIIAKIELRARPSYILRDVRRNIDFETGLSHFDEESKRHRHYECWWFPYSDRMAIKALDETNERAPRSWAKRVLVADVLENSFFWLLSGTSRLAPRTARHLSRFASKLVSEGEFADESHIVFPSRRGVRFNEIEYCVPIEQGVDCMREIRDFISSRRIAVQFPLEYRVVAADDIWLSPFYHRDSAVISAHMYVGMPYRDYFDGVEIICRNHGGRPHWGKMHNLTAPELRKLYPEWDAFHAIRRRLDPRGMFLNTYLKRLFDV